jgi:putative Mn2+ efflux pump MntP
MHFMELCLLSLGLAADACAVSMTAGLGTGGRNLFRRNAGIDAAAGVPAWQYVCGSDLRI